MELKELSFDDECSSTTSSMTCVFQLATSEKKSFQHTLVVQFSGTYRYGSSGAPDAAFMRGMIGKAVNFWQPNKLIIDLSSLVYTWGNNLFDIALYSHRSRSTAIVFGPDCREGLSSLIRIYDDMPDSRFFDTVKEAFDYLQSVEKSKP
ncbi:MAG: hypothetical protein ACFFD4_32675 [Candidatus Odinarchaeota archaeon]